MKASNLGKIKSFLFDGNETTVQFITSQHVNDSVACDVYSFVGDTAKDLGIIRILAGGATPMQRVVKGTKTIEGFLYGAGTLVITSANGHTRTISFSGAEHYKQVEVMRGQTMQWRASENSNLVVYEICYPPFELGRFQNID